MTLKVTLTQHCFFDFHNMKKDFLVLDSCFVKLKTPLTGKQKYQVPRVLDDVCKLDMLDPITLYHFIFIIRAESKNHYETRV